MIRPPDYTLVLRSEVGSSDAKENRLNILLKVLLRSLGFRLVGLFPGDKTGLFGGEQGDTGPEQAGGRNE